MNQINYHLQKALIQVTNSYSLTFSTKKKDHHSRHHLCHDYKGQKKQINHHNHNNNQKEACLKYRTNVCVKLFYN